MIPKKGLSEEDLFEGFFVVEMELPEIL
jgi:hypothetical protein